MILGAVPARAAYISVLEGTRPAARRGAATAGLSGAAAVSAASGTSPLAPCSPASCLRSGRRRDAEAHGGGRPARGGRRRRRWRATAAQVVRAILKRRDRLGSTADSASAWSPTCPAARFGGRRTPARARLGAAALPALAEQAIAAAVAAIAAVAVTAPLDTLKTRVQLGRGDCRRRATCSAPRASRASGRARRPDSPPRAVGRHHGVGLRGAQAAV